MHFSTTGVVDGILILPVPELNRLDIGDSLGHRSESRLSSRPAGVAVVT
jgi:hypothetical protein